MVPSSLPDPVGFPIVGIGASAGGLEAFLQLLGHLPVNTGMAFVLVQHLSPDHKSALPELLQKVSPLPVEEVTRNVQVKPNQVYTIPPDHDLTISRGILELRPRAKEPLARSIDTFFESLAADRRERAIGVVLSGTASDGTLGLEAIKAEGGITFAQDESAKYDSMPRNAIAAGVIDFVLSPAKIAEELARIASHPYVNGAAHARSTTAAVGRGQLATHPGGTESVLGLAEPDSPDVADAPATTLGERNGTKNILLLLARHSGVDFTFYKPTTIQRRIHRRMVLGKITSVEDYATLLQGDNPELERLYSDVLIHVTSFFRNPEEFDFLQHRVFPQLIRDQPEGRVRIWVPGCSTGQEAYSIAMAISEVADRVAGAPKFQVFGTDLNAPLLATARAAFYAKTAVAGVSPERLKRFFTEEQGGYRVGKQLRDAVVFAPQNLLRDPPFSRLDLVCCRNLLIYLEPSLQKKVFATFHYALKPGGVLFLGTAESVSSCPDLFAGMSKKHKVFSRKAGPAPRMHFAVREEAKTKTKTKENRAARPAGAPEAFHGEINVQRESDRVTLNRYAPCSVLVNGEFQVQQFRGDTSRWLKMPAGKASFSVLRMASEGVLPALREALGESKKGRKIVRRENVRLEENGHSRTTNLEVIPLKNLKEPCYLIFFEEVDLPVVRAPDPLSLREAQPEPDKARGVRAETARELRRRVADLERELVETRDSLQSFQEQSEATHEELQCAHEEVTSANEELQSLNEEMETSKEEVESANEELTTVNEELASRNTILGQLNSDLTNLQDSVDLAIVLLGRDLTIRRFSAKACVRFNLVATDIGRPFEHVRHNLDVPDMGKIIQDVIDTLREYEGEVQNKEGHWYSLRVKPYVASDQKIDGAVLVLMDIDALKRSQREIRRSELHYRRLFETARDGVLIVDPVTQKILDANPFMTELLGYAHGELLGKELFEIGLHKDQEASRAAFRELQKKGSIRHEDLPLDTKAGERREVEMVSNLYLQDGEKNIQCNIHDITERKQVETQLRRIQDTFFNLIENSPFGLYIVDAQLRMYQVSSAAQRVFTYVRPLIGRHLAEVFRILWPEPDDLISRFRHTLETGEPYGVPNFTEQRSDSGAVESYDWRIERMTLPDGQFGVVCYFYDVSERQRAEEALRQSEERFRSFVTASSDVVYRMGPDWGEMRQLQGRNFLVDTETPNGAWLQEYIHPGDQPNVTAAIEKAVRTKSIFELEHRVRRVDGTFSWTLSRAVPLLDAKGEIVEWIGAARDVTERKRSEEVLRESEDRYRSLFNSIDEGFCVVEMIFDEREKPVDWRFLEANPSFFNLTGLAGIEGKRMRELAPDHEAYWFETYGKVALTGEPVRFVNEAKALARWFDLYAFRIGPVGSYKVAVIFTNVTERKRTEGALRLAQTQLMDRSTRLEFMVAERTASLQGTVHELESFSYSVMHDLRAPLRALISFGELLQEEQGERLDEAGRNYLVRILAAARRLDLLTRDILSYSQVTRQELQLEPVDVEKITRDLIRDFPDFQRPKAEVEIRTPLHDVMAHEASLGQCITNLLTNAVKFVPRGTVPRIIICTERIEDAVRIWFEDNGIGVAEQDQKRIFKIFERVHPATLYEGTGIGLAIVRKTIERMGGTVGMESEPGSGSRFWIQLPGAPKTRPDSSATTRLDRTR